MEIREKIVDDVYIIGIPGRMDNFTSKEIEAKLNSIVDENRLRIIIDLAEVDYISSVGLRVLLSALKRQNDNYGSLELASLQPFVEHIFEITGLNTVFSIYPSQEAAIKAFDKGNDIYLNKK